MNQTSVPIAEYSEIAHVRGQLKAKLGDRIRVYAWPPFRGTHQRCYQAIAEDKELVAAEGFDLALLVNGGYTQNTPQWRSVKKDFKSSRVRSPHRVLLIPTGTIDGDRALSGILVERDIKGKGLSTRMQVPNLSSWKQNSAGVYVPGDDSVQGVVFFSINNL
jgi:hypothetical protein